MNAPDSTTQQRGLLGIFAATFCTLVGYFMLTPWLLLRLKGLEVW